MSFDLLSTSGINSLINSYKQNEVTRKLQPLEDRKIKYKEKSSGYSDLSSKLDSLKTLLKSFKETGSDSIFAYKSAETSNSEFLTATATSSATASSYGVRINQLAKADSLLTSNLTSATASTLNGTHSFAIKTGDGETGEFTSNVEVEFDGSETYKTALEKIQNAINSDKAIVTSAAKDSATSYTGSGSFTVDLNGTETTIDYDYTGKTYEEVVDDLVVKFNDVSGVKAEKVVNGSNVELKLEVVEKGNYITIDQTLDTGGLLGATELNINVDKEKGSSGIVDASLFSPKSGESQLSITSKNTGVNFRLKDISDTNGGLALAEFGLNIGASRPSFDQATDPDTVGFVYSDITEDNNLLNAKFDFNGISMQRDSNSVSDLVTGVTFTLNSEMQAEDKEVAVAVKVDKSDIREKVDDFIKKFNDVYTYMKNNTTSAKAIFRGDSNTSALLTKFRTFAYSDIEGITDGNLKRLSQIGLSFNTATGLSVSDSTLFENEVESNTDQVEALFNSTNGIATELFDTVDPFLGIDGYLATLQSSMDKNVKYMSDKIDSTSDRIDKSADVLRSSYEKLQLQMASLLSNQSFFGGGGGFF